MPRALSSDKRRQRGATLVELLVVLTIMSILAVTALPFAETTVQRRKEIALRETLRDTRMAIDAFHTDWKAEKITGEAVSDNGYPVNLAVLVEGVEGPDGLMRYLRRLPENPFVDPAFSMQEHWVFYGYKDPPDAPEWSGEDIYDLRPRTERTALDGSQITDW